MLGQVTIRGAEADRMVEVRTWLLHIAEGRLVCAPPVPREVDPGEPGDDAQSTG